MGLEVFDGIAFLEFELLTGLVAAPICWAVLRALLKSGRSRVVSGAVYAGVLLSLLLAGYYAWMFFLVDWDVR